jgi:hypothetical protein
VRHQCTCIGIILIAISHTGSGIAQDLEPRRWTALPIGMNVLGAAVIHTDGDIAFDPVLQLDDVTVKQESALLSFLHAFDIFGQSARFDVRLPFMDARWEGLLAGEPASTKRRGFADPRLRLSVNFLGAPALKGEEFQAYRTAHPINTTVGAALAVTLPLGEYKQDKLLNLGQNRYVFEPQLGFVHTRDRWSYELTGSVYLYTDNNEFFGNNRREQDPLYELQAHLTYTSLRRWWISLGAARDRGGESKINGVRQDDRRLDLLFGISAGLSIGSSSSVKLIYVGSRTHEDAGTDADSVALTYLIRF